MATPLLGLALPTTGSLTGTWGTTVNNSITSLLDSAVAGTTTLSTDVDVTLTTTQEAANQAREAIILWTASGTTTRYITAPAQSKTYIVINSSGTQSIVLRGVGPTTGITIIAGEKCVAAWNGTDFIKVSTSTSGTVTSVGFTGGIVSVGTPTSTPAFTVAGTSGGIPYFSSGTTWASSAALAANALVVGGGAGATPATVTTGTGVLTFLGTPSSANLASAVTDETGSGALVFATSPTLVTPVLGTPSSGNLANCTFPTLNQNTSGTAAGLSATLAVGSGGTGQTTYTDGQLLIGNTTGNTLTKSTLTAGSGVTITNGGGSITIAATGSGGTVTGVTATSPVASSGGAAPVISLDAGYGDTLNPYASKTANYVLAAPNGSAGVPTFRALVAADIPTLNQNTTGSSGSCTGNAATATSATTAAGLSATLVTGSGGTGLTSFTANGILYASSSSVLATGSALSWDGTTLNARGSSVSSIQTGTTTNRGTATQVGSFNVVAPNASGSSITWGGFRAFAGVASAGSESSVVYISNMQAGVYTDAIYVSSNGNIGIGSSNPLARLSIGANSAYFAALFANIAEIATVSATAATGTISYDISTQSVLYYTTNASANWTVNFRMSSGTSLDTAMSTGQSVTAAFLVTQGSTAYYNSAVQVDGSAVTPKWQNGSAPSAGNASSVDVYTYTIVKTGAAAFTVFASQTKFA